MFQTVDQGVHSRIREARQVVIRDIEAWRRLWAEHVAGRIPKPSLPPVDFTREMVIAFFLEEKPTSGYEVEIVEIIQLEGQLLVKVRVKSPLPGVPLLQVLTQPHHIVKLPRYELPVEFSVVGVPSKTPPSPPVSQGP